MIYIIYGAPCSGKSTYIKNHAKEGDLICDVDLIYSAISVNQPHEADLYIHEIALKLKECLFDIIENRAGKWNDVYITSIANNEQDIDKLKNRVKADEVILIDTPYEVCMERSRERPDYFKYLIAEWFNKI